MRVGDLGAVGAAAALLARPGVAPTALPLRSPAARAGEVGDPLRRILDDAGAGLVHIPAFPLGRVAVDGIAEIQASAREDGAGPGARIFVDSPGLGDDEAAMAGDEGHRAGSHEN